MGKRNYLHTQKKTNDEENIDYTNSNKVIDPCTVCKKELYYDDDTTQRIGILEDNNEISGWACPHCDSQFDLNSNITNFYGAMKVEAKA